MSTAIVVARVTRDLHNCSSTFLSRTLPHYLYTRSSLSLYSYCASERGGIAKTSNLYFSETPTFRNDDSEAEIVLTSIFA